MLSVKRFSNYLPPLYSFIAIFFSALFFIYVGRSGNEDTIGRFSVISTIIFLLTHLFSLGNDHSILSSSIQNKNKDYFYIDKRIFIPLYSFFLTLGLIFMLIEIELVVEYMSKYIPSFNSEYTHLVITIALTVFLANFSKTLASFLIINSLKDLGNLIFLFKAIGLGLGIAAFIFIPGLIELHIVFIMELVCASLLVALYALLCFKFLFCNSKNGFQLKFVLSGLNIFGFDSILKQDLLVLSLFQSPTLVAKYAVISSVFEGIAQTITSLQQNYASKLRNTLDGSRNERSSFYSLIKSGTLLSILFFPAAVIFFYIVFGYIDHTALIIIFILQAAILIGSGSIICFFTDAIIGNPLTLLLITLSIIIINLLVSIFLFQLIGVIGVSIGSLFAYSALRFFVYKRALIRF